MVFFAVVILFFPYFFIFDDSSTKKYHFQTIPYEKLQENSALTEHADILIKEKELYNDDVNLSERSAWALQVGSYRDVRNLELMRTEFQKKHYTTYTRPAEPVDGEVTLLYIGPETNKASLEKIQQEIQNDLQINTKMVSYSVIK